MIRIVVGHGYDKRTYTFSDQGAVIGSAPDADLVLMRRGAAPRHVRVSRRDDKLLIEDLRGKARPRVVDRVAFIRIADLHLELALHPLVPESVTSDVERALLDEIRQRPDDPALRTVYSDWLEQNGHHVRAEFLRTQLALRAAKSAHDPAFQAAAERLADLALHVGEGWRARVAMAFIERCPSGVQSPYEFGRPPALGLEIVCPMRWDMLAPTDREDMRSCSACNRQVAYCTSVDQAKVLAEHGHCVAIDVGAPRAPGDMAQLAVLGQPSPPLSQYGRGRDK